MGVNLGIDRLAGEEHREVTSGQGRLLMLKQPSSDWGRPIPHPWEVYA